MPIPKLQQKRAESGVFRSKDMLALLRANVNNKWIDDMTSLTGLSEEELGDSLAALAVTNYGYRYPTSYQANRSMRSFITTLERNIVGYMDGGYKHLGYRDLVKNQNTHERGACFFFVMFGLPVHVANGYLRTGIAAEVARLLVRGESIDDVKAIASVMKKAKLSGAEIDENIARALMESA